MSDAFHGPQRRTRGPLGQAALASFALLVGVLVGLGAAVGAAAPAAAHASLQFSSPEADQLVDVPPEEVRLIFDEPVELGLGGLEVIGPDGERLDGPADAGG